MCKKVKHFSVCNSVEFGDKCIAMKHDRNGVPVMGLVKVKVAQSCLTLRPQGQSIEFSRPEYWSSCSLLQGIFPNQGSNPGLLHCRWTF